MGLEDKELLLTNESHKQQKVDQLSPIKLIYMRFTKHINAKKQKEKNGAAIWWPRQILFLYSCPIKGRQAVFFFFEQQGRTDSINQSKKCKYKKEATAQWHQNAENASQLGWQPNQQHPRKTQEVDEKSTKNQRK